ncbi:hypothetical protein [Cryptosporangium minutisporangium]|uniref:Uncharacterized protein n=1 Tax=Cryptosporangium minutisporangium TaxID=113569 RepID=A0ABP6SSH2_9ACTN
MSATNSSLRLPRQTRGIHRGPGSTAAAAGGVQAAGLVADLGQTFDDWTGTFIPPGVLDTIGGWLGSIFK